MKTLVISSFALKSPPRDYGGLERVAYEHSQGLAELGHDVTMVASQGSRAPSGVTLLETLPSWDILTPDQQKAYAKADRLWNGWRAHEEAAYLMYKDKIGESDVVLDMSWAKWSYMSKKDEIVGLCHSIQPYQTSPPREFPMFAGVSRAHARFLSFRMHKPHRVIWNPVNVEDMELRQAKEDRFISLNRIMATKGIHLFLDVVEKANVKADVVGDDSTLVPDQGYVQAIKERCKQSANAQYYGLVEDKTRNKLLERAKALVCMKDGGYEEIFGLQAVEALACGTPVIAMRSWGFEDTIVHGKTGLLCDSVEQVMEAVKQMASGTIRFDPSECRKQAELFKREVVTKQLAQTLEAVKHGSRW